MYKKRLHFTKTGRAKYLSHLDILRTFQRVFKRAGVKLKHSEGFNPHPVMAFALPLSVGVESLCELLNFELLEDMEMNAMPALLNRMMPEGIAVVKVYNPERKFSAIKWLRTEGCLAYDAGVRVETVRALDELFRSDTLVITRRSKKGPVDFDIVTGLQQIEFNVTSDNELGLNAIISAQDPTLNPNYLITAIQKYCPEMVPDDASFRRVEIFDQDNVLFR